MTRRVTVVTAGHLATCPRMLKAADAFHAAGYDVRVVSACHTPWAAAADRELYATRRWRWQVVDFSRAGSPARWFVSGVRARAASRAARLMGGQTPLAVTRAAFGRAHAEIVRAILRERQDFIYGGTAAAIGAVAEASRRSGTPCGIDFEDLHCGEHAPTPEGALHNRLARPIMIDCAAQASFITAGSAAIADACRDELDIPAIPIHNVFTLPERVATPIHHRPLRMYWFSQTIGQGRGLDDVVTAAGQTRQACELHLRGVAVPDYVQALYRLAERVAPALQVHVHPPSGPERMIDDCREFDVGLAAEDVNVPNRAIALTNKALTYPLAPLAIAMTRTRGQEPLAHTLNGHAVVYAPGDAETLAAGLEKWMTDRRGLHEAKDAAWEAARTRWHWEHPLERDTLLAAVERALS